MLEQKAWLNWFTKAYSIVCIYILILENLSLFKMIISEKRKKGGETTEEELLKTKL